MAKRKYFIALQTPFVEVPVTSLPDASGQTSVVLATFKRYSGDEAEKKFQEFNDLFKKVSEIKASNLTPEEVEKLSQEQVEARIKEFQELVVKETQDKLDRIDQYFRNEIIRLREVPLFYQEEGSDELLVEVIPDTKTATDNEDLWGAADKCLAFLLDMMLASAPWRPSFVSAAYTVLVNTKQSQEAEIKN